MASQEAKALVKAICYQESMLRFRRQMYQGPATGFAQFEQGGGVRGVIEHAVVGPIVRPIILSMQYEVYVPTIWAVLEHNDILAFVFARLLVYTVPQKLPGRDQWEEGWRQYQWAWRPGKPHPEKWRENYDRAWKEI
jgi:hypothetical protein